MDRFIELKKCFYNFIQEHLKSNMDRFIVNINYGNVEMK